MKQFFYLVLLTPIFCFSQESKQSVDYVVEFNTSQFSKKVDFNSLISHPVIEGLYEEFLSFNLKEFITYVDKLFYMVVLLTVYHIINLSFQ